MMRLRGQQQPRPRNLLCPRADTRQESCKPESSEASGSQQAEGVAESVVQHTSSVLHFIHERSTRTARIPQMRPEEPR